MHWYRSSDTWKVLSHRHTQALDHNDNRKEVQNNSRRLRAACRGESDQGRLWEVFILHPTIALLEWCLLCSAGPGSILADDISMLWAWFVYCRSESWPGRWEATVYSVWSQMTDGLLLHTQSSRLTLNTEHLADFQRRTPDFTKRADDPFSVGFREEGTTVQNGLFTTFRNREILLSSNHNQNVGRVRSHWGWVHITTKQAPSHHLVDGALKSSLPPRRWRRSRVRLPNLQKESIRSQTGKTKVTSATPTHTHSPPKLTSRPIRVTGTFLSLALSLSWNTECERDTHKKASTCPGWKQPTVINTLPLACAAWCLFSWHFLPISAAPLQSRPGWTAWRV